MILYLIIQNLAAEIYRQKVEIINKLEELTKKETELYDDLDSKFSQEAKSRDNLNYVIEEIKGHLMKAIELEMHKGDLRLARGSTEIRASAYVLGMCKKYGVKLGENKNLK